VSGPQAALMGHGALAALMQLWSVGCACCAGTRRGQRARARDVEGEGRGKGRTRLVEGRVEGGKLAAGRARRQLGALTSRRRQPGTYRFFVAGSLDMG